MHARKPQVTEGIQPPISVLNVIHNSEVLVYKDTYTCTVNAKIEIFRTQQPIINA